MTLRTRSRPSLTNLVVALPQLATRPRTLRILVPEIDFARFSRGGLMQANTRTCRNQRPRDYALLPDDITAAMSVRRRFGRPRNTDGYHTNAERMFPMIRP